METGDVVLTGSAINVAMGYFLSEKIEIAGRWTSLSFDDLTGAESVIMYTLGLNNFIVGHKLKVQSDLSYTLNDGSGDALMFRTGFELHF